MTRFFKSFLVIFCISFHCQATEIEWTATKPHGLAVFLETVSGQSHRSAEMRKFYFATKESKSKEARRAVDMFSSLTAENWENIFDPNEKNAYHRFLTASIESSSIDELENKSQTLFRKNVEKQFFSSLRTFEPIYTSLVWDPYGKNLEKYKNETKALYDQNKKLFDTIAKFYDAENIADKLWVGFYPSIQKSGAIYAENMGQAQSVGIFMNAKDNIDQFGTIMHEFSHYLFSHQSQKTVDIKNQTFLANHSPGKSFAYAYFDEMMATVCGNGWAVEKMTGKNTDSLWYNDPTIEKYARAVYPFAKQYLDSSRTIDASLFSQIINTFTQTFPSFGDSTIISMGVVLVLSDKLIVHFNVINSELRSTFDTRQITVVSPIDADQNRNNLETNPVSTRLFIISQNTISSIKKFFESTNELRFMAPQLKFESGSFQLFSNPANIPEIIIYANNPTDFRKAISKLGQQIKKPHIN